jgi:lipoprotein NlpD
MEGKSNMSSNRTRNKATKPRSTYAEFRSYGDSHYAMDWASVVRFTAPTIGLVVVLGGLIALTLGAGCTSKPGLDAPTANVTPTSDAPQGSALQVSPPAPTTPAYVAPSQPSAYAPPSTPTTADPVITPAPTLAASTGADPGASAAGSTYTVQHGDTLFRIAKQHYGNGKQWARIVSANPGLTPANLKAGQKIVLP